MREILTEQLRLPIAEAARRMKISRRSLYAVLQGEGTVTAGMALRFVRLTGAVPDLYLQMQARYDLWRTQERLAETLADIEPLKIAIMKSPSRQIDVVRRVGPRVHQNLTGAPRPAHPLRATN